MNWLSAIWILIAALGFLVSIIMRGVHLPGEGYGNCGRFADSDYEQNGSLRGGRDRRRRSLVKNAQLELVEKEPRHQA